MITDGVRGLYHSKRLHYIKADENDEIYVSFQTDLQNDPALHALVTNNMIRPQGSKDAEFTSSMFSKALLGVAICLSPSEDPQADTSGDKQEKPKPKIIGQLCIGWGGVSTATVQNRTASMGVTIAPAYQNKGYGREAINWALDWAFRHGNLHTVSLSAASFNTKAMKLYEAMGFTMEGRLRQTIWFNRSWHDEVLFSMVEDEWEVLRGESK